MPQRIVISFRGSLRADGQSGLDYLGRALATKKRAEAHGASLCAWSAQTFSFDFAVDELEEAISLASLRFDGEAPADAFGVGISQGELSTVGEGGSFASLCWGPPLVSAVALARDAAAGQVLIDPELLLARSSEIGELGYTVDAHPTKQVGGLRVGALRPAAKESVAPPSPPPVRSAPPLPPPAARVPAKPPPPPIKKKPPPPLPVVRYGRPPMPSQPDDAFSEMAKRALMQGDTDALERLITEIQNSGEHAELVERMSGFVALRRGATAEALRRLRTAAGADQSTAAKARARLAYGVALASAGRVEAAVLEALDALARAREANDVHGERACVRFLARLSAAAGHPEAGSTWARVAAARETVPPG